MVVDRDLHIRKTREIPNPSYYVKALDGEFSTYALNEERAFHSAKKWRESVFLSSDQTPLDLEIGTGNGFHFAHHAAAFPQRNLLGVEIKFKPLIQAIRRTVRQGSVNARMIRYNAHYLWELFREGELNNIYIHFPDPWIKRSKNKNRVVNLNFLEKMYPLQKSGSFIEFKTDNLDYFNWAMSCFEKSPYKIEFSTFNLHESPAAESNFITQFETIFIDQGMKINFAKLIK